jgi:hypothetical protein
MAETTSTEFVEWQEYFEKELNMPRREDYYLAQIAAEVYRGNAKTPASVRTNHFLLKFTTEEKKKPISEAEIQQRTVNSKVAWFAIANMTPRKPPPQRKGS